MTAAHPPRLFGSADQIRALGNAMLACALPKDAWTHEAHLAVCLWLATERPDVDRDNDLGGIIRRYNVSIGGVNDETQGYHETITRVFVYGVRRYLARHSGQALLDAVNGLLCAPEGARDYPLAFYSAERLFSVEARLLYVDPDRAPLA